VSTSPEIDARRVLALRLAGQGLAHRQGDALGSWAVQDSPPGAAATALLARGDELDVDGALLSRDVVALYNARTATAIVPAAEAAAYGSALLPADDDGLKAIVGPALPERGEGFAEPVALAVAAVEDALDGAVLSRDDLHEALRQRLPLELLPWCPGCGSHHARRGLLVLVGLHGRLCIAGRAGRQPAFARTDQWVGWDPPAGDPGAELVRRYLTGYGPSTPAHFAQWTGLGAAHARELWGRVSDELAAVGERMWLLARDVARLEDPPPAPGIRLLGAGDPLLLGRDRETLIPDAGRRKQVWAALGGAGIVLCDGEPVALWRARKQGRRLAVTVDAFAPLDREALRAEAERLVPLRGCATLDLHHADTTR
jgi:hypothetical protein